MFALLARIQHLLPGHICYYTIFFRFCLWIYVGWGVTWSGWIWGWRRKFLICFFKNRHPRREATVAAFRWIKIEDFCPLPQILSTLILIYQNPAKDSPGSEKRSYICGLRARIECEPEGEHSTRSDRVTDIGSLLSLGASPFPLPAAPESYPHYPQF